MFANRFSDGIYPFGDPEQTEPAPNPLTAVESEHLLKVAGAVTEDAIEVWAELWGEFRDHVTPDGQAKPEMAAGFVPQCGWGEFLERFWLLKHHLDSASRVCKHK
jgi:hypothetical protein